MARKAIFAETHIFRSIISSKISCHLISSCPSSVSNPVSVVAGTCSYHGDMASLKKKKCRQTVL